MKVTIFVIAILMLLAIMISIHLMLQAC